MKHEINNESKSFSGKKKNMHGNYIEFIVETAKANYCKLEKLSEYENPMKEAIEFINDIIDYIAYYARTSEERQHARH
ncbi:MAG: hypothetical protein B6U76_00810 [Desulfurococcales archaeon ex4484_217_2]|nr:MAG: hypothetical protein B6U76_00810 [Desulfurococcales archaeon ex4484_217_2]